VRGALPQLRCDGVRVGQVLRNLVGNAIKFTPAGGRVWVELETGEIAGLPGGRSVLLRVLDDGVGIPDGEYDAIFDKFTQSSRTRSKAGGTGLGLAICREIVQAHAGAIWAENRGRGGACFTVALPIDAARPGQAPAAVAQRAG
jgi:signal transduction histidine kinase